MDLNSRSVLKGRGTQFPLKRREGAEYAAVGLSTAWCGNSAGTYEECATCPAICAHEGSPWARCAAVEWPGVPSALEPIMVCAMQGWRPQRLESQCLFCQGGKQLSRGWGMGADQRSHAQPVEVCAFRQESHEIVELKLGETAPAALCDRV